MSDDLGSLGNFKGVMLCNRPAQIPGSLQTLVGPSSGGVYSSHPSRPAFVSAVVAEDTLGLPPVRHARVQAIPRRESKVKSDDVTWRHKKWLTEFQERRIQIQQTMQERVQQHQERAKRFTEKSQAMRDAIRGIQSSTTDRDEKASAIEKVLLNPLSSSDDDSSIKRRFVPTEYVDVSQQYPAGAPLPVPRNATDEEIGELNALPADVAAAAVTAAIGSSAPAASSNSFSAGARGGKKIASKPGWARTSAEADAHLDAEADELLEFANGLDYDKYMDDLEVREAIRFVKERVKGLEESKQTEEAEQQERERLIAAGELEEVWVVDDSQPVDSEGKPHLKKIIRRTKRQQRQALNMEGVSAPGEGQNEVQSERDRHNQQDVLAKTLLDSNRNLRNIHSSASVRAIVEQQQNQQPVVGTSATTLRRSALRAVAEGGVELDATSSPQQAPVITTIYEKDSLVNKGVNPSNLPFLYRHPGI